MIWGLRVKTSTVPGEPDVTGSHSKASLASVTERGENVYAIELGEGGAKGASDSGTHLQQSSSSSFGSASDTPSPEVAG